jgi:quercetin dioxygenase-like cupin family protein
MTGDRASSLARGDGCRHDLDKESAMREPTVVRLGDTAIVKFGPDAHYQPILGDEEGTTPIRTGIQTSQPGYVAPMHSHPYLEVLHILDGTAEAWIEGGEARPVLLRRGDTIALQPDVPHSFRVVGDQELRLLGTHVSPRRIVEYKDGARSDARGYRVWPD